MSTAQLTYSPTTDFTRSLFGVFDSFGPEAQTLRPQAVRPRRGELPAWAPSDTPRTAIAPTAESIGFEVTQRPEADVKRAVRSRVFDLLKYSIEDDDAPPSASSIAALNTFLAQYQNTSMPLLASDSSGNLVATWRRGQVSMLSLKFIEGRRIEYAWAFDAGKTVVRDWGEASWGDFMASFPHTQAFLGGGN
jgi:hypothetical protein